MLTRKAGGLQVPGALLLSQCQGIPACFEGCGDALPQGCCKLPPTASDTVLGPQVALQLQPAEGEAGQICQTHQQQQHLQGSQEEKVMHALCHPGLPILLLLLGMCPVTYRSYCDLKYAFHKQSKQCCRRCTAFGAKILMCARHAFPEAQHAVVLLCHGHTHDSAKLHGNVAQRILVLWCAMLRCTVLQRRSVKLQVAPGNAVMCSLCYKTMQYIICLP